MTKDSFVAAKVIVVNRKWLRCAPQFLRYGKKAQVIFKHP